MNQSKKKVDSKARKYLEVCSTERGELAEFKGFRVSVGVCAT